VEKVLRDFFQAEKTSGFRGCSSTRHVIHDVRQAVYPQPARIRVNRITRGPLNVPPSQQDTTSNAPSAAPCPPPFGLSTAVFVVVSSMVGTGVLTTSGFTVYFTGSNQLMLALWVVGGVLAACGALTLCELAAALPRSGGDYIYLREAYGPLAAFLSGWVSFLIGFGGPIAASASAAAHYLLAPLQLDAIDPDTAAVARPAVATLAIGLLATVHCLGRRSTIRAQAGMTLMKLVILAGLAAAGLVAGSGRLANLADRPPLTGDVVVAMASSLVYISYAYTGWNAAAYVAGEVDRPQERVPLAIIVGTTAVILLYLALNLSYALAISAAEITALVDRTGRIDAVAPIAQIAAERLFGSAVAGPLSVAIGLTLFSSASAYVLAGPRVACAMARDGRFPAIAGRVSASGAPVSATLLQVGWAAVLLWTASFERILVFAGVGLALFSMLAVAAVFVLRRRRPDLPRPFRTPGYPWVPAVYLVGTAVLTAAVFRERPVESLLSLAAIAAGIPVYLLTARAARSQTPSAHPASVEPRREG
jgi:APA family basic amino acid/polyamine antiporter